MKQSSQINPHKLRKPLVTQDFRLLQWNQNSNIKGRFYF